MNTFCEVLLSRIPGAFHGFLDSVKSSFSNFSVFDAIDIFLLSIILFLAFRFLKSRKAGALLIGVAVIVTLTLLARIFDLQATHYIFSKILEIGVLALVIIFQPEIRDALEKVGSGSVNSIMTFTDQKHKKQLYFKAIDHICTAVSDLSRTKTGALIVISRTTKLDEVTETGVLINADVNSFLLRNLFFNKAPLHDGAVIIEDGKVIAASCLLPLTRRTDLDGDLGTRHRAAIGLTEVSDAIVIVVSEETGIISVSIDGNLERNFNYSSLKQMLISKVYSQILNNQSIKNSKKKEESFIEPDGDGE